MKNFVICNSSEYAETVKYLNLITADDVDCKLYFSYDEDYGNKEEWDKIKHLALEDEESVELIDIYWDANFDPDSYAEEPVIRCWHFNKRALDLLGIDYLNL